MSTIEKCCWIGLGIIGGLISLFGLVLLAKGLGDMICIVFT